MSKKMKLLAILFTLGFGASVLNLAGKTESAQIKTEKAPSFTLKLLNGGEFKSSELREKVAVLKFVASW